MTLDGPRALLRFSKAEWLKHTIDTETFRFTPIECWRRLERTDRARGDSWEGAAQIDQPSHIKSFKIRFPHVPPGEWIEHELVGPIVHWNDLAVYPATHGLCFNMLTDEMVFRATREGESAVDLNRFGNEFGPSLLVITNVPKFLELMIKAIKKSSENYENSSHGAVTYVSEHYNGPYSIFHKPDRHAWQKEFRIVLDCRMKMNEPVHLSVPGLNRVCSYIERPELYIPITRSDGGSAIQITSK